MTLTLWFWIWLVLALVLSVAELFTAGLFMLPFAIGAAVSAMFALAGLPVLWQVIAYFIVSAVAFAALRVYVHRWQTAPYSGTGGNRLIGRPGVVTEPIDDARNIGLVRVDREVWRADAPGAGVVPEGSPVVVVAIEGVHLIVRPDPTQTKEL